MKKVFGFAIMLSMVFSSISCSSGGSDDDTTTPVQNSDSYWTIGQYKYDTSGGLQSDINSKLMSLVVSDTGSDASVKGSFLGSSLTVYISKMGAGEYVIASSPNENAKVISFHTINVGIGTGFGGSSYLLKSGTTGKAEVTVDDKGKYHITIKEPITLVKFLDMGIGSPNEMTMTVNNLYVNN